MRSQAPGKFNFADYANSITTNAQKYAFNLLHKQAEIEAVDKTFKKFFKAQQFILQMLVKGEMTEEQSNQELAKLQSALNKIVDKHAKKQTLQQLLTPTLSSLSEDFKKTAGQGRVRAQLMREVDALVDKKEKKQVKVVLAKARRGGAGFQYQREKEEKIESKLAIFKAVAAGNLLTCDHIQTYLTAVGERFPTCFQQGLAAGSNEALLKQVIWEQIKALLRFEIIQLSVTAEFLTMASQLTPAQFRTITPKQTAAIVGLTLYIEGIYVGSLFVSDLEQVYEEFKAQEVDQVLAEIGMHKERFPGLYELIQRRRSEVIVISDEFFSLRQEIKTLIESDPKLSEHLFAWSKELAHYFFCEAGRKALNTQHPQYHNMLLNLKIEEVYFKSLPGWQEYKTLVGAEWQKQVDCLFADNFRIFAPLIEKAVKARTKNPSSMSLLELEQFAAVRKAQRQASKGSAVATDKFGLTLFSNSPEEKQQITEQGDEKKESKVETVKSSVVLPEESLTTLVVKKLTVCQQWQPKTPIEATIKTLTLLYWSFHFFRFYAESFSVEEQKAFQLSVTDAREIRNAFVHPHVGEDKQARLLFDGRQEEIDQFARTLVVCLTTGKFEAMLGNKFYIRLSLQGQTLFEQKASGGSESNSLHVLRQHNAKQLQYDFWLPKLLLQIKNYRSSAKDFPHEMQKVAILMMVTLMSTYTQGELTEDEIELGLRERHPVQHAQQQHVQQQIVSVSMSLSSSLSTG